jgi:hypothetical protein
VKPSGFILYHGPSMLDGAPIVAIATGFAKSGNRKTGAMIQTWIIRADMLPTDASKAGADASVCGGCPHRWATGGACYVNIGQAPQAVFRAFRAGRYPHATTAVALAALGKGRAVRLGSYGDPAAVPADVWRAFTSEAAMHTGYTHQWASGRADSLRGLCMASADTAGERDAANAAGWRTFRIMAAGEARAKGEAACPASAESGHKLTCAECGACNGADSGRRGSIAIVVHGSLASRFRKAA